MSKEGEPDEFAEGFQVGELTIKDEPTEGQVTGVWEGREEPEDIGEIDQEEQAE